MPYFNHNDTRMYYETEGSGSQTLLFVHGFLLNTQMFEAQVDRFKHQYRCVLVDLKGHGLSEAPGSGYDVASQSQDIVALMDYLELPPVHFIGHSMGGFIGLQLAMHHPDKIKSLTLLNSSADVDSSAVIRKNKLLIWIVRLFGISVIADKSLNMMFSPSYMQNKELIDDQLKMRNRILTNSKTGIIKTTEAMMQRPSMLNNLKEIPHPTLIIGCEEDQAIAAEKSKQMHELMPQSELHILQDCGHASPVELPDDINDKIEAFLSQQ